jgi:hypothetical protein
MPALYAGATAACLLLACTCTWCALACADVELLIYAGLLVVGVAAASAPQAWQPRVARPLVRAVPQVGPHMVAA